MAEPSTGVQAIPLPPPERIERAERFTRESFVHAGEEAGDALAPGTPRRRALERALAELDGRASACPALAAAAPAPPLAGRRDSPPPLGLERVLSEDEPTLVDGTTLSAH